MKKKKKHGQETQREDEQAERNQEEEEGEKNKKKKKKPLQESELEDGGEHKAQKKKKKHSEESGREDAVGDHEMDDGNKKNKKKKKKKKKKKEHSQESEGGDAEDQHEEQDSGDQKKKKKKKKRDRGQGGGDSAGEAADDEGERPNKKKRKGETGRDGSEGEGAGDGGEGDAQGEMKKKKKKKDKETDRLQGDESGEDPGAAGAGGGGQPKPVVHPFKTEDADHAETPLLAYQHIEPLLAMIAQQLGKSKAELQIYDPYFCTGAIVRNMREAGFPNVYNKCEDFYAVIREKRIPPHDVVVTNPPYSADHVHRIIKWCVANGKPWFLLVPNYVYMKDFYESSLAAGPAGSMVYLCPDTRYLYQSPKGVANALGETRKSGERKTAPFMSFWYIGASQNIRERMLQFWGKSGKAGGCTLCKGIKDLPHAMRDSFDPLRKRLPKHLRQAMKKTHAADGRPLCKQCGQIHGNCKHTKA